MKTDLAPTLTPDLELMPRADLPVIWDEFRAKAEQLRETANTLVVSSVRLTQKWLDVGQPICPTPGHGSMKADLPKGEEEEGE